MLDIVDRHRHRALEIADDAVAHLVRRQAVIAPHDAHDRNADIGKNIDRRARNRQRAENQKH